MDDCSEARTSEILCKPTCRIQNPDTPRAGRVGRRTAGRLRGGPGRIRRRRVCSRRTQPSLVPSRASKTTVLNSPSEARTSEILCKPMEEQSPRLTRSLSPGREALFVPGCWPMYQRLFVFVNPCHARHVREKNIVNYCFLIIHCRDQNKAMRNTVQRGKLGRNGIPKT